MLVKGLQEPATSREQEMLCHTTPSKTSKVSPFVRSMASRTRNLSEISHHQFRTFLFAKGATYIEAQAFTED